MKYSLFTSVILIGLLTGCGSSDNICCQGTQDENPVATLGSIAPVAIIAKANDKTYEVGEEITLDGMPSSDQDGSIVKYEWENGTQVDGGTTHTTSFESSGEKTVYLTVTDNDGLTNTTQTTLVVQDPTIEATTPVAVITQPNNEVYTFSCIDSYDQDENGLSIEGCEWGTQGFNDQDVLIKENQGILDESTVTIQPCGAAAYAVITLTVTDNEGETNTTSHKVEF